ncbi:hypothetical protein [Nocardia sp. NPDC058705]|uniref:hypothetical protein n=1 Tax=Nocardia sp. NPDC058705 TaxID=3346609 RepID=UPI00369AF831
MNELEIIATAVAAAQAGALTGITKAGEQAITDAYVGLQARLRRNYGTVDVAPVAQHPDSRIAREALARELAAAGAESDGDLLAAAELVIQEARAHAPGVGGLIGVDLENVEAEAIRIKGLRSTGSGARLKGVKVTGRIDIEDVEVGGADPSH